MNRSSHSGFCDQKPRTYRTVHKFHVSFWAAEGPGISHPCHWKVSPSTGLRNLELHPCRVFSLGGTWDTATRITCLQTAALTLSVVLTSAGSTITSTHTMQQVESHTGICFYVVISEEFNSCSWRRDWRLRLSQWWWHHGTEWRQGKQHIFNGKN